MPRNSRPNRWAPIGWTPSVSLGVFVLMGLICLPIVQVRAEEDPVVAKDQARSLSESFRYAAQTVSPAVVTVITKIDRYQQTRQGNQIVERLVPEDGSVGSGVIIHKSGVVLTNSHVLDDASRIIVRLPDGREYETYDLRRDSLSDVAIFRITNPPKKVDVAKLGDSDTVEIGDWVLAIGSPFELEATVSAGIISGKNRTLDKIGRGKLLQTDAAINPGNSGGPLVNLNGEIIGLNTAIASSSGGYQGIGFAIPINNARWVVNRLASKGKVTRGYLGVTIAEFQPRDATARLPAVFGVLVTRVTPNTAADQAGLKRDDIILKFADIRVKDVRDLQGVVERKTIGSQQNLSIIRDGEEKQLVITVQATPSSRRR